MIPINEIRRKWGVMNALKRYYAAYRNAGWVSGSDNSQVEKLDVVVVLVLVRARTLCFAFLYTEFT